MTDSQPATQPTSHIAVAITALIRAGENVTVIMNLLCSDRVHALITETVVFDSNNMKRTERCQSRQEKALGKKPHQRKRKGAEKTTVKKRLELNHLPVVMTSNE